MTRYATNDALAQRSRSSSAMLAPARQEPADDRAPWPRRGCDDDDGEAAVERRAPAHMEYERPGTDLSEIDIRKFTMQRYII